MQIIRKFMKIKFLITIFSTIIITIILYIVIQKNSTHTQLDDIFGSWQINSTDSRKISQLCSNSKTVNWDEFEQAIAGKIITIDEDSIVCNSINASKPITYTFDHGHDFYYCLRYNGDLPLLVKKIDSNTIRIDWSVNIIEVYNKIK